jgi:hypothetical protein
LIDDTFRSFVTSIRFFVLKGTHCTHQLHETNGSLTVPLSLPPNTIGDMSILHSCALNDRQSGRVIIVVAPLHVRNWADTVPVYDAVFEKSHADSALLDQHQGISLGCRWDPTQDVGAPKTTQGRAGCRRLPDRFPIVTEMPELRERDFGIPMVSRCD